MIHEIISSFLISILLFAFYLELQPSLTNIWFRENSDGIQEIQLKNLVVFSLAPCHHLFYWYPNFWDINFFIWWLVSFLLLCGFNHLRSHKLNSENSASSSDKQFSSSSAFENESSQEPSLRPYRE